MCVIIVKEKMGIIPNEMLVKSSTLNPHGLGITWLDTYETEYFASEDWNVLSIDRPFIAHFRYATIGLVNEANTHPFPIGDTNCLLYQNGSVHSLGDRNRTDAEHQAEVLAHTHQDYWGDVLEQTDCRWVVVNVDDRCFTIYNKEMFVEKDGVMYSKQNVIDAEVVSVYGTLKEGFGNNSVMGFSKLIDRGETVNKYPMIGEGIPFVLDKKGVGNNVVVEVYCVDKNDMEPIDRLEGHPDWYERRRTQVKLDSGDIITTWLYFNDTVEDDGKHYKEFMYGYDPHHDDWYGDADGVFDNPSYEYYQGGNPFHKNDGLGCNKCNGNDTCYDDYVSKLWCFDCDAYVPSLELEKVMSA